MPRQGEPSTSLKGRQWCVYLCLNLHILKHLKHILTSSLLPLQTLLGLVQLEILRVTEPLTIKTAPHQTGSTQLTLKNASSFPLRISLSFSDHCQVFSISPPSLTMSPGTRTSLSVSFTPGACSGTLNRYGGYSRMVLILFFFTNKWDHDKLKCVIGFIPQKSIDLKKSSLRNFTFPWVCCVISLVL